LKPNLKYLQILSTRLGKSPFLKSHSQKISVNCPFKLKEVIKKLLDKKVNHGKKDDMSSSQNDTQKTVLARV
jgi:SUMO ligase MMS21 Smc5/6 complex component